MFLADSDWIISSVVRDVEGRLDKLGYERLNAKLQVYFQIFSESQKYLIVNAHKFLPFCFSFMRLC